MQNLHNTMHLSYKAIFILAIVFLSESFFRTSGSTLPARNTGEEPVHRPAAPLLVSERYISGYTKDTLLLNSYSFGEDSIPFYSHERYAQRVNALQTTIPIQYNHHVGKYIEFYTNERRFMLSKVIGRSYDYFPVLKEALAKNSMPAELVCLAVIESALDTNALSKCGALGLWQFMPGTAKIYKLKVNGNIDERKNIERSTEAAVKFLRDLHAQYGDWLLALAAYNAGPGRVNSALKNTPAVKGKKKDFWAIMHKLPKETQGYVPGFIAMCYLMNHYPEHNLKAIDPSLFGSKTKPVSITSEISILEIARSIPLTAEEIVYFNPRFDKAKVIPANSTILLPSSIVEQCNLSPGIFASVEQ